MDRHVDLGDAPGRSNTGDKTLTLVASALAGGDCIDDADVLSTGRAANIIGCVVKAPSTLGTILRSFRWGPSANWIEWTIYSRFSSLTTRLPGRGKSAVSDRVTGEAYNGPVSGRPGP